MQLVWGAPPPRVRCWAPSPNTRHLEGRRTVWNVALRLIRPARAPVGTRGARGLPDFNCIVPANLRLWPAAKEEVLSKVYRGAPSQRFRISDD